MTGLAFSLLLALEALQSPPVPKVLTVSSPVPYAVNAYVVEGPGGLVVIDTLRTAPAAEALIATLRRLDKPVVGVLLTHTHPDHIGGLLALTTAFPDAVVYASPRTTGDIASDRGGGIAQAAALVPGFGPTVPTPDRVVISGQAFEVGGLTFQPLDIGLGEAEHMTLFAVPALDAVFAGDVAGGDAHPWLVEGRSEAWLGQVDELQVRFADVATVYPGHGPIGPVKDLFDEQRRYLEAIRALVGARITDGALTADERDAVVAEMDRAFPYPDVVAPLPNLKAVNVEAVGREMIAAAVGSD